MHRSPRTLAALLCGATALFLGAYVAPVAPAAAATSPCSNPPKGYNVIKGTSHADYLIGTNGPDVIEGLGDDDTLRGEGGNDIICGGDGYDLIEGGPGNDKEYGEGNNDVFQNSPPTIYRAMPNAKIPDGGSKTFTLQAASGTMGDINVRMTIDGPTKDLSVYTISPGGIRNKMVGQVSNGTQFHGTTFDSEAIINIQKSGNKDYDGRFHPAWSLDSKYRYKPAGGTWKFQVNDAHKNGQVSTLVRWSLEIDYTSSAQDGSDLYSGGSGTQDLVDYTSRTQSVNVSLNGVAGDGGAGENDNAGADAEWIYSGFGADTLTGNGLFNDLRAGNNNDHIYGLGGNDRFRGGNGNDYEDGGPGSDKLDGNEGTDTCVNGETYFSCEIR